MRHRWPPVFLMHRLCRASDSFAEFVRQRAMADTPLRALKGETSPTNIDQSGCKQRIAAFTSAHRVRSGQQTRRAGSFVGTLSLGPDTSAGGKPVLNAIDDYVSSFQHRLLALSSAYNVLSERNWEGASLRLILERTLSPYTGNGAVMITSSDVSLRPKPALSLCAGAQGLSTTAHCL